MRQKKKCPDPKNPENLVEEKKKNVKAADLFSAHSLKTTPPGRFAGGRAFQILKSERNWDLRWGREFGHESSTLSARLGFRVIVPGVVPHQLNSKPRKLSYISYQLCSHDSVLFFPSRYLEVFLWKSAVKRLQAKNPPPIAYHLTQRGTISKF